MFDLGMLVLRAAVGGLLAAHGLQKLAGWWGGSGPAGNAEFLRSLGYRRPRILSWMHGGVETIAGLLLVLGLMTPIAAGAVIAVMLNAIIAVHAAKGLWSTDGGVEYPLVLAITAATLAMAGPGGFSLDRLVGLEVTATWAALGVIGGLVVGLAALAMRQPQPSRQDRRQPLQAA